LSPKEMASLHNANVTVDMLAALDRINEIQKNCKVLTHAGCNALAQDIIDQTSSYMVGLCTCTCTYLEWILPYWEPPLIKGE